ncbi:hypothetical protein Mal35_54900 [Gimesia maris]|uniref:hypothetical protein n=1 Tax=Gimesia maris TaxID=122 RepID=UPI001188E037|nr:hypothetical protein [Gimesia maris]QDT81999.1 hypothetical protein Mal35_54900 [Gimesia maris]
MFFPLRFVSNHPIYRVHEIPETFLYKAIDATTFGNHLVPSWFRNAFDHSETLQNKMKAVFEKLQKHDRQFRIDFHLAFLSDNNVKELCDNKSLSPTLKQSCFKPVHDSLHTLMTHLYKPTLTTKGLSDAVGGVDVFDHYEKFIEENSSSYVCPFCGLNYYRDPENGRKEAYDHWLCQKNYPASAVNFKNLVPMCPECNESPNKGQVDVLYEDSECTKRRRVLYPYNHSHGVAIKIDCVKHPGISLPRGEWKVEVTAMDSAEEFQIDTWKTVFNIEDRLANYVARQQRKWYMYFLVDRDLALSGASPEDMRTRLEEEVRKLEFKLAAHLEEGGFIKAAFFAYCLLHADDTVLFALAKVAESHLIHTRAKMARSVAT